MVSKEKRTPTELKTRGLDFLPYLIVLYQPVGDLFPGFSDGQDARFDGLYLDMQSLHGLLELAMVVFSFVEALLQLLLMVFVDCSRTKQMR